MIISFRGIAERKEFEHRTCVVEAFRAVRHDYRRVFFTEFFPNAKLPSELPLQTIEGYSISRIMLEKASAWYVAAYGDSKSVENPESLDDDENRGRCEKLYSFPWIVHDLLCRIINPKKDLARS